MSFPSLQQLLQPFGSKSPMGLAWSFVGYSPAFSAFTGWSEVIAGILLVFRRTTTPGAILGAIVMGNIVAINFCFDVPVKLFSSILFIMNVFLIAPDFKRLMNLFVLNKSTGPSAYPDYFKTRRTIIIGRIAKAIFVLYAVYGNISGSLDAQKQYGDYRKMPPLRGIYNTDVFIRNGDTLKPLTTDKYRWKNLIIDYDKNATVKLMNDDIVNYTFKIDTIHHEVEVFTTDSLHKSRLYYTAETEGLVLNGKLDNDSIKVYLKKVDLNSFDLISRGFHWVNERPYHR